MRSCAFPLQETTMTTRLAISIVRATVFSSSVPSLKAQALAPPRDDVEAQFRAYGTRVRLFESVVLKRLDEIKPKGKDVADRNRRQDQEMVVAKADKVYEEALLAAEMAGLAIKGYVENEFVWDLDI